MVEEKRDFIKSRNNQNEQARYLIESVENMYQSKLNILKQRRMNDNNEHRLIQDAQKRVYFLKFEPCSSYCYLLKFFSY